MNRSARHFALRTIVLLLLILVPEVSSQAQTESWMRVLGGVEFEQSFVRQSGKLLKSPLAREKVADEATACAAFANAYKASHDPKYQQRAKEIAEFLLANSKLASDGIPGWGPKLSEG